MRHNAGPVLRAVAEYLTTTTLHGLKYLYAPHEADRVVWMVSCITSACCAGVLCSVLWSRFIQVPNLLSLRAMDDLSEPMPVMGLCVPTLPLAGYVIRNLFGAKYANMAGGLSRVISGRPVSAQRLGNLSQLLQSHGSSLQAALTEHSPACDALVIRCRANGYNFNCSDAVVKELTSFGPCCALDTGRLKSLNGKFKNIRNLHLIMHLDRNISYIGYDLVTRLDSQGWLKLSRLTAQRLYMTSLRFEKVESGDNERLSDTFCESDSAYSRADCLAKCVEEECGCADPFRNSTHTKLPICPLSKIVCLRSYNVADCNCIYSCRKVSFYLSVDTVRLDALQHAYDPLYKGLNESTSIVLSVDMKKYGSRVFTRMPTENWLTLLSSLGGVFNMFLGVGLFSALELLYFILVKLPIALKNWRT